MQCQEAGEIVNNEPERMWKEAVVTLFEVLLCHLCRRTKRGVGHNSRSQSRELNKKYSKYKAETDIK
jgi:hypothetical protein